MSRTSAAGLLVALLVICTLPQANAGMKEVHEAILVGSYATALKEIMPLAEQGVAEALFILGGIYYKGRGVTQDYQQAIKWYTKAAEQGVTNAQHNLGIMYFNGEGVPQSNKSAYVWWNIAAFIGNKDAITNRDIIRNILSPQTLAEAQELSAEKYEEIERRKQQQQTDKQFQLDLQI